MPSLKHNLRLSAKITMEAHYNQAVEDQKNADGGDKPFGFIYYFHPEQNRDMRMPNVDAITLGREDKKSQTGWTDFYIKKGFERIAPKDVLAFVAERQLAIFKASEAEIPGYLQKHNKPAISQRPRKGGSDA